MNERRYGAAMGKLSAQIGVKAKKVCFYFVFGFANLVNVLALFGVVFFLCQGYFTLQKVVSYADATLMVSPAVLTNADESIADENSVQAVFSEESEVLLSIGDSDIRVTANNMIVIAITYFAVALVLLIALIKNCSVSTEAT